MALPFPEFTLSVANGTLRLFGTLAAEAASV
jgi:hypothetical protein